MVCFVINFLLFLCVTPAHENVQIIDDFQQYEVGVFPDDWKGRKKKAKKEYTVKLSNDNKYLEARSEDSNMFIIKKCDVDAKEYPYLNWKWRVKYCSD